MKKYGVDNQGKIWVGYDPCSVCNKPIRVMCFQNTGVCSENCRKIRDGEVTREQSIGAA